MTREGWPEGVWLSTADAMLAASNASSLPADTTVEERQKRAVHDLDMTDMLAKLLIQRPDLTEKALVNLKPYIVDQVKLRVAHADTISRLLATAHKDKTTATAATVTEISKGKKKAKTSRKGAKKEQALPSLPALPGRFMTASQEAMFAICNGFTMAAENRRLLLDHPDADEFATINRFTKADNDGQILALAIEDRQSAEPLYVALDNLFKSMMKPSESIQDWAKANNKAMTKVTVALWKSRDKLEKTRKKVEQRAAQRLATHQKTMAKKRDRREAVEADKGDEDENQVLDHVQDEGQSVVPQELQEEPSSDTISSSASASEDEDV